MTNLNQRMLCYAALILASFLEHRAGASACPPPQARHGHAMVYDAARGQVILFGGSTENTPAVLNDTWIWDGSNWTLKNPAHSPSARYFTAIAYDAARKEIVLFGGTTDASGNGLFFNDTWIWDGTDWTKRSPIKSPSVRTFHSMVYDAGRQQIVLFGGGDSGGPLDDTWTWDGANWTLQNPADRPPGRGFYGMAYDDARQEVVLFGGYISSIDFSDTWAWDGANWTQKTPNNLPPARDQHAMVYDSARKEIVLFGGSAGSEPGDDTWIWNGTDWTQKAPAANPSGRRIHAMAFDSVRNLATLFGGDDNASNLLLSDTWLWDGVTWSQPPTPRSDLSLTVTPAPMGVKLGDNVAYSIIISNKGPASANGVVLTDVLPNSATLVSASVSQGAWSITNGQIVCNLGPLPHDTTASVSIVVTPQVAGTMSNNASVTGCESDPILGNNSVSSQVSVSEPCDTLTSTLKLIPTDDALVLTEPATSVRSRTNENWGAADYLEVFVGDGSVTNHSTLSAVDFSFLRFDLSQAPNGIPTFKTARLHLNVLAKSGISIATDRDILGLYHVTDNRWSEGVGKPTVGSGFGTTNNSPDPLTGITGGNFGIPFLNDTNFNANLIATTNFQNVGSELVFELVLPPSYLADGFLSLAIMFTNRTLTAPQRLIQFSSKEGKNPPFLEFLNESPKISAIGDQTTPEHTPTAAIGFTVSDAETQATELIVNASSSNTNLLPIANITLGGTGTNRTVTLTPSANQSGNATVTLMVTDGCELSASTSFVLSVTSCAISLISDFTILEDTSSQAIPFTISASGTPTATSWNEALIPTRNIVLSGSGTNWTLIVTPAKDQFSPPTNQYGGAYILVVATNSANQSCGRYFKVTVLPVNDPPSFTKGPDQVVEMNSGAHTVPGWATNMSAGPANESEQSVNFVVLSNSNPGLFSTQPAVSAKGALSFTPATGQSGSATVTIQLKDDGGTANGGQDTSPSQKFTITVTNAPPKPSLSVAITAPSDRATFCPETDITISVMVSNVVGAVKVDFYAGSKFLGNTTNAPYQIVWAKPAPGDYSLTAKASDSTGSTVASIPVTVAVSEVCGGVAIVPATEGPEIGNLQADLFEMGLNSRVFPQAGLTIESLKSYQLIIWDDLGRLTNGLTAATVDVLQQAYSNGTPLYFIGEHLAASANNLPEPQRAEWLRLIHLNPVNQNGGDGMIELQCDLTGSEAILKGRYGVVEDFEYPTALDATLAADDKATALGKSGSTDALVVFPRFEETDTNIVRTVAQNFLVASGTDPVSLLQRKQLFQNLVCWLLHCPTCGDVDLVLESSAEPNPVSVGGDLVFTHTIKYNGECGASGVVLTNYLPSGVSYVSAESTRGTNDYLPVLNAVVFNVGLLPSRSIEGQEPIELKITVTPQRHGIITNVAWVRANNPEASTNNNYAVTTVEVTSSAGAALRVAAAVLSIEASVGTPRVRLSGTPGVQYAIEVSTNPADNKNWQEITRVTAGADSVDVTDSAAAGTKARFYRARAVP
ncbi:MAG: DUF11 domain-containing protein [Verrucomicrobia bacterium]|nr:DUF11 domain-containing protein [Verrucomicrobiota bacterium]